MIIIIYSSMIIILLSLLKIDLQDILIIRCTEYMFKHIKMKRPKEFKKLLNNGSVLNHYNSIIFHDTYFRYIFKNSYQGIVIKIILKWKNIPLNKNTTLYHLNLDSTYIFIFNDITRIQGIKIRLISKIIYPYLITIQ